MEKFSLMNVIFKIPLLFVFVSSSIGESKIQRLIEKWINFNNYPLISIPSIVDSIWRKEFFYLSVYTA